MFPPASAARSTTTEPSFIDSTISLDINFGAGLPGIRAVDIKMSTSLHCLANNSISAFIYSGDISLAYPPVPSPDSFIDTSKNSAPSDCTCSFTAARVSKALTMAPMFLAVPMADNPATPPPMTSTFAGGIFPAAVI